MQRITNEENDLDHNVEGNAVGPVVSVRREQVLKALNEMKTKKTWPFRSITRVDCC